MDEIRSLLRNEVERVGQLDGGLERTLHKVARRQRHRGFVLGIAAAAAMAAVVAGLWVGLTPARPAPTVSPGPHPSLRVSADTNRIRAELQRLIHVRASIIHASADVATHEAQLAHRATRLRIAPPGETASERRARLTARMRVEAQLAEARAVKAEVAAQLRNVDARIDQLRGQLASARAHG